MIHLHVIVKVLFTLRIGVTFITLKYGLPVSWLKINAQCIYIGKHLITYMTLKESYPHDNGLCDLAVFSYL